MRRLLASLLVRAARWVDPCAIGHEWTVDHEGGVLSLESHCVWCGCYRWTPGHRNVRKSGIYPKPATVADLDGIIKRHLAGVDPGEHYPRQARLVREREEDAS